MNGFKHSKDFIYSECDKNPNMILAIQEHWLRPPYKKQFGVNQLRCLHPNFDGYGTSAMTKTVETNISLGRPFGGTGFLFNKKYAKCLKPLLSFAHDRVTALQLESPNEKIILINIYFPYYNVRDIDNHVAMYRETIGFVENIIQSYRDSKFIILSDFNCNIYDSNHRFSRMINDLMAKYDLVPALNQSPAFDPSDSYTRFDLKTNSFTLIDGILISNSLKSRVSNVTIMHSADNVSDHLPVSLDIELEVCESFIEKIVQPHYVNWKKLTSEHKQSFRDKMSECLANIVIPRKEILHGIKCCEADAHKLAIEQYYRNIVTAVLEAESILPKTDPNRQRSYWNDSLSDLKQQSINCQKRWKDSGCPKTGPVFDCYKQCHYSYKLAIRRSKSNSERVLKEKMTNDLTNKNGVGFWRSWEQLNKVGSSLASRINGETDEEKIANEFASYFKSVYSGSDGDVYVTMKDEFDRNYSEYYNEHINDNINCYYVSWSEMLDIASKIEIGKSTSGALRPEHFIFGDPQLLRHMQMLFNGMLQHSFVPSEFTKGVITPIVKDTQGDISSTSNYRGITLSCLPAKLFEFIIQKKTAHLLGTDELQFGFKSKTSTSHAIYTLKSTVDYYNKKGSSVYVAFMDCSKAFDRISHHGLFSKLIDRKVPLCILMCLVFWYSNMTCYVKWGSKKSGSFEIPLGIKQGGINSPDFFSCYFSDLICILRKLCIGCHLYKLFLAIILFADDICLIAPSRSSLQRLIDICADFCHRKGLNFNPKKSKILVFSNKRDTGSLAPIKIGNSVIEYVTSITYLGVTIVSDRGLRFCSSKDLKTFYRASNSVLSAMNKPSEEILIQLLYSNCIPILSYASEIKTFSAREMADCNTAVNNALRRIFSYNRWESVSSLRENFQKKSLTEIFSDSASRFQASLSHHPNSIIRHICNNLVNNS